MLKKLAFSRHIFEKYSKFKFHENLSREELRCSIRTDGRTEVQTNIQTAMMKITVALRNFAYASKNREMEATLLVERNGSVFAYMIV